MKYIIPLEDNNGDKSRLSLHFGRAPFYAIITFDDSNNVKIDIKQAPTLFHGEVCDVTTLINEFNVNAAIVKNIGPKAVSRLENMGVKLFTTNAEILSEVIKEIKNKKLIPLDLSKVTCKHGSIDLEGYKYGGFYQSYPMYIPFINISAIDPQLQSSTGIKPVGSIRIAIATTNREGLNSQVASVFARAPTFTIIDVERGKIINLEVKDNVYKTQPHGAGLSVAQFLASIGVNIVVGSKFGPKAAQALSSLGIEMKTVPAGMRVKDVLSFVVK